MDSDGKRKRKWIATGLPVKGNKRKAEAMLVAERQKYQPAEYQRTADANMLFADYMLYWLRQIKSSVDITTYAGYKTKYLRPSGVKLEGNHRQCDAGQFYHQCKPCSKRSCARVRSAVERGWKWKRLSFSYMENPSLFKWCRWWDSNPHGVAPGGFWIRYVYQFHHTGIIQLLRVSFFWIRRRAEL